LFVHNQYYQGMLMIYTLPVKMTKYRPYEKKVTS
jgi:hypothetical protein